MLITLIIISSIIRFMPAGDAFFSSVNRPFSTHDSDNDGDSLKNCADLLNGGWWFTGCSSSYGDVRSNLNGEYSHPVDYSSQDYRGIRWSTWDGHKIVKSEMKIKKKLII